MEYSGIFAVHVRNLARADVNFKTALLQLRTTHENTGQIQAELFYFDMYGPGNLSFQTRYRYAGGGGKKGTTTVHGTAS
ncbi:MAG TPA: hypothetical protein VHI31_04040 [Actinomycetota bacterium]|nr:hypothetical protein [Actinomycetota bacterium]